MTIDERVDKIKTSWCAACGEFHGGYLPLPVIIARAEAGDEVSIKLIAFVAQEKLRGNSTY